MSTKIAISHRLAASPLQQCSSAVRRCAIEHDVNFYVYEYDCLFESVKYAYHRLRVSAA